MFTTPMPSWKHTHDIFWHGQVWPVMEYPVDNLILFFNATGCVDWMKAALNRFYLRGRLVQDIRMEPVAVIPGSQLGSGRGERPLRLLAE